MSGAFSGKATKWATNDERNSSPPPTRAHTSFNTVQDLVKERPNIIHYGHVFCNDTIIYKLIWNLREKIISSWSRKV